MAELRACLLLSICALAEPDHGSTGTGHSSLPLKWEEPQPQCLLQGSLQGSLATRAAAQPSPARPGPARCSTAAAHGSQHHYFLSTGAEHGSHSTAAGQGLSVPEEHSPRARWLPERDGRGRWDPGNSYSSSLVPVWATCCLHHLRGV